MWWLSKWAAGDCNAGVKPFNLLRLHSQVREIRERVNLWKQRGRKRKRGTNYDGKEMIKVSKERDTGTKRRRICYVALTQYFFLGPCVVYYLQLLCFCPTSSAQTRCANNTPAKLIGNTHTHTYKHTGVSASILASSWHEYSTLLLIQSELLLEAIFRSNQKKGLAGRPGLLSAELDGWNRHYEKVLSACLAALIQCWAVTVILSL